VGQTTVEYWVFRPDHRRCILSGDAAYGKDGRLLSSNFWRNDPQLRFAGSPGFPNDVFPSRIPPSAVLLTLDSLRPRATGKLNMILGRYGYMTFDLWAQDIEKSTVPAGTFRTLKVVMRVNADSVMKYWPAFLSRFAQPFFPQNVFYYDTAPPHHLVKFIGSFGYLAPKVTVDSPAGDGYRKLEQRLTTGGVPQNIVDELLEQPTIVSYSRGAFIFLNGAPTDLLFWVSSGLVDILSPGPDGKQILSNVLGPGEFFGFIESPDHKGQPAQAFQARARTNVQIGLHVRENIYKVLSKHDPALLLHVTQQVVAGLSELLVRQTKLLGENHRGRLKMV
jgi:hypothetical protein